MKALTSEQLEVLEHMVDASGVTGILQALVEICQLKAEHIHVNWQDDSLAQRWKQRASKLDKLATKFLKK